MSDYRWIAIITRANIENTRKRAIRIREKQQTQHLSLTLEVQQPRTAIINAVMPDTKMNMCMYELN